METLVAQFRLTPDTTEVDVNFVDDIELFFTMHEGTLPEAWNVLEALLGESVFPPSFSLSKLIDGDVAEFYVAPSPSELRQAMIDWAAEHPDNAGALANHNLFIPTADSETAP